MKKKTNAQFAIEFIVLLGFMFLVFVGFLAVVTNKILDAKGDEKLKIAEEIALIAKDEIDLASGFSDGYKREFQIPNTIDGNDFDIEILFDRELVVNYLDAEYVVFLPDNVEGNVGKGVNEILKVGGKVVVSNTPFSPECDDNVDNDGDGLTDFPADIGCLSLTGVDETDCGDNVCEGFETCTFCSQDCGVCLGLSILLFTSSSNFLKIDGFGNGILKGTLTQGASPVPGIDDEFIFRNNVGQDVAILNLVTGNMVIEGSLNENQGTLSNPATDDFLIRNSAGTLVSYIDSLGNFFLKGSLTENGNP